MKLLIDKLIEKQYTSKAGKPYTKYWIQSDGDWYSAFKGRHNPDWKEGDMIEVAKVTVSQGNDGKTYRNIERPEIEDVYSKLAKLEDMLLSVIKQAGMAAPEPSPVDEQQEEYSDVPF